MLLALVDQIDDYIPEAQVVSLSTYPTQDRVEAKGESLEIVSYKPPTMAILVLPLALLVWVARVLGFTGRVFARTKSLRVLMDADVVADLAGISFSDGRGLPTLTYNTLMTGIPLLVGTPVVKCSQALGSFDSFDTRFAARLVLPKVVSIVARGPGTAEHLKGLGLSNFTEGSDLAFSMKEGAGSHSAAESLLRNSGVGSPYFVVSPSSVVKALCESRGIDYAQTVAEVTNALMEQLDMPAVVVAHSARPGQPETRMNDLPVCQEVFDRLDGGAVYLDDSLDPRVLRAVVDMSEMLMTSRFHAMISGLATETPTVVVGWSHKYREVMAEFGQERFVVSFEGFEVEQLIDLGLEAARNKQQIVAQISAQLPSVKEASAVSFEELAKAIDV